MKNKYLIISALFLMCAMTSCAFVDATCDFFTASWGTSLKRDLSETYGKMDSKQLADMIEDPAIMSDREAGKELLVELGKRDITEELSAEQKDDVLNLMVNSSITTDSLAAIVNEVTNVDGNTDPKVLASTILGQIDSADTKAVVKILSDIEKLPEVSGSSACLAVVCVVAQVAKNSDVADSPDTVMSTIKDFMTGSKDMDQVATTLGISNDDKEALKAAIDAAGKLAEIDAEIFPGVKLSAIFS